MTNSVQDTFSKEDRFALIWRAFLEQIENSDIKIPPYSSDTRHRDDYLLTFSRSEPILSGVLATVVSRDKNRSWSLTGGNRLVSKYGRMFHSLNNGEGWRNFISILSTSYYSTNFGYAAELGFNALGIPETMWSFDSTKLRNLGREDELGNKLYYYSKNNGIVGLKREDYIFGNSMPSVEEELRGAGFCAVERSLTLVRIMIGLLQYQMEKLKAAPSKGIALFKNIEYDNFKQAVEMANEQAKNADFDFYRGILSLFTDTENSGIELTSFSELPDNFDLNQFIEVIVQTYSLAFGYSVGEFWSIASGSFGRTGEMKVQEQMATAKGELEFALSLQEQIQNYFLPPSLTFAFDVRNDSGDLIKQEVISKKIENIIKLYEAQNKYSWTSAVNSDNEKNNEQNDDEEEQNVARISRLESPVDGSGILTREEARQLLVDDGIIPSEWTRAIEEEETIDLTEARYRAKNDVSVLRTAKNNPDEPIIQYIWSGSSDILGTSNILRLKDLKEETIDKLTDVYYPKGNILVLYEKGSDLYKRNY